MQHTAKQDLSNQKLRHSKQRKTKKDLKTDAILMMYQTESLQMLVTRYEN